MTVTRKVPCSVVNGHQGGNPSPLKGAFDKAGWKDATDEEKKALREKMAASRKEWAQQMRAHQNEVHARIKEIREEFKNNRDEVIDGNKPGE